MKKESEKAEPVAIAEPAAEYVALDKIHAWPRNPHPPSLKNVRDVARSIKRFGFGEPILARRENGEIIAGHCRLLAAHRLRLDRVPVRWSDLPESEAHVLALADNKLASNRDRDWTDDSIAAILEEAEAAGTDVEVGTGFDEDEIDKLLAEAHAASGDGDGSGDAQMGNDLHYQILVQCRDEKHQGELLGRLEAEGLVCKPSML
jgi:hypothetical protein